MNNFHGAVFWGGGAVLRDPSLSRVIEVFLGGSSGQIFSKAKLQPGYSLKTKKTKFLLIQDKTFLKRHENNFKKVHFLNIIFEHI